MCSMIYFYLFCVSLGLLTFALIKRRDLVPATLLLTVSLSMYVGYAAIRSVQSFYELSIILGW